MGGQADFALAEIRQVANMKVAVVTGSSNGIGLEAARELALKGFHVVFACRNQAKTEPLMRSLEEQVEGAQLTFIQLDTGKMKSVKAFAAAYQAKFDRLDVLVHNAGSGYFKSSERITEDGLEAFFQTNYLGPFLLTKLFLDLLKSSHGRVVCVSSIEHWEGSYDFEKVAEKTCSKSYATSKLMQMLFAFELQKRHGLMAAAVNPGAVMSGIWWYLRGWKAALWNFFAPLLLLTTSQGCQTIVHAATAPEYCGPTYFTPYRQTRWCPFYSDMIGFFNGPTSGQACPKAYNEDEWKKLWELSEEAIRPFL